MITDYEKFVNSKLYKIRMKYEESSKKLIEEAVFKFQEDLESEFSKYLDFIVVNNASVPGYVSRDVKSHKIFLLDEDFGLLINSKNIELNNSIRLIEHTIYANIVAMYKSKNVWAHSSSYVDIHSDGRVIGEKAINQAFLNKFWSVNNGSDDYVEIFIKEFIEFMKKKNINRKIDKEKRELKRYTKKYNL
jgi:hypothetical protein